MTKEEYCNDPAVKECLKEYTEGHKQYTESTIDPETVNTDTAGESTANTDTSERH